ncbi:MAG TPA: hypothetical protein VI546_01355 [candidate division Zixibacteria bacterium]|nr:hypothetical protein [candidate division Zixibacteria bacterium]
MKVISLAFSLVLMAALLFADEKLSAPKSTPGFEKLKSLTGEWQAKTKDGQPVKVSYKLVSNGSALIETLEMGKKGEGTMVTVYHLDGDQLMMTHYCSANNQPRMKAQPASGEIKSLTFSFLDATNLAPPDSGHMHRLMIIFQDEKRMTQEWTWREYGKDAFTEVFEYKRK